jgi:predicted DCC family thiol-disulfide oxidoreductase YuxK
VQFVLRRDHQGIFRFASLQSDFAARVLGHHHLSAGELDTVYVVIESDRPGERLLARADAVLFVLRELGGGWGAAAVMLRLLPRFVRDFAYNAGARRRYRIFGRTETCVLPAAEYRGRFMDV